jgi:glycine/D-amino acid oxidase-like deaminating enzyme/nitrite reductase/ring-hydroxylating ferredoxin subunit
MKAADSGFGATSVWMHEAEPPPRSALQRDLSADTCIVGGGIAGLTTAYLLAQQGQRVVVLEKGKLGGGMSAFTTGHLTHVLDDRYFELERYHGEAGARLAAESHTAAVDLIDKMITRDGIDCDFRRVDGYLFAPPGDTSGDLDREFDAARRAGLEPVREALAPIRDFDTGPALRFPNQAQFHPLRYLDGLAAAIVRMGGQLFCNTHATELRGGSHAVVCTAAGPVVRTRAIVVATNVPFNDRVAIHTKQAPYTTYAIAAPIPGGIAPGLYWDTRQSVRESGRPLSYHYVRACNAREPLLIIGGEDHKSGQAEDGEQRLLQLEQWARERWSGMGRVRYRWSGQVMEPNDGLAFIGRNPMDHENVYIATGDSGNGLTHGTIAGMLISDLVLGEPNSWAELYEPRRVRVRAAAEFVRENLNVVSQYAKDFLGPGEVADASDIAPGEGALMRRGLGKVAVYRDPEGSLHCLSPLCPHLGCSVHWNTVEKTWDCPCHGSRFAALGTVLNGPANTGLPLAAPE